VSADPALVAALAESVLPPGLGVAARDPTVLLEPGAPQERDAVHRAVPRRVAEFHAGRAAARDAMARLSLPPLPVPMGVDRAPVWPEGLTGSISHSATACVAAVGPLSIWAGIGVDLEEATPLDPMLVEQVCTRAERRWLGAQPQPERGLLAKLIFSAKEATYKAQYPTTGRIFGFDVIEISIDRGEIGFKACFQSDQGVFAAGTILGGSYVYAAGLLVTGVAVGQSGVAGLNEG
jgi:4'-phosphopantetheinyl transferase EntD